MKAPERTMLEPTVMGGKPCLRRYIGVRERPA